MGNSQTKFHLKNGIIHQWNKEKYIIIKNYFNIGDMIELQKRINILLKHPLASPMWELNNGSIDYKNREQTLLYATRNACRTKNVTFLHPNFDYEKSDELFKLTEKNIYPILHEPLKLIMKTIGYDYWEIGRMTVMHIPPEEPEQEIHYDAMEGNGFIFIAIPLHDTPIEMGGTIYYNNSKFNELMDKVKKKPMQNFGFFKDRKDKWKKVFEKERVLTNYTLGDISIHKDDALHSGGENKSKKTRHFLFIVLLTIKEKVDTKENLDKCWNKIYDNVHLSYNELNTINNNPVAIDNRIMPSY
jgi:hypothetical protein